MTELEIREATNEDAPLLAHIYHYVLNTHITFDTDPVSAESRVEWLSQYNRNPLHRLFVGTVDNNVIGFASSDQFRPKPAYYRSVETTIYLSQYAIGNAWGRRLYQHLLDQLRNSEVKKCYSIIALPNKASIALNTRLGYKEVGHLTDVGFKFNRFWDTLWMERSI